MSLSLQDAQAIAATAQRLKVDPRTLGALMEMESGLNPNIWGGAGGQYRGLIQFGPGARKEVGLPDRQMSIAEQMPFVEKYFQQRGFTPGKDGTTELYRTVLVGNPRQSGTDSFGTNSDSAAKRMMPGGDLYKRFSGKFDQVAQKLGGVGGSATMPMPPANPRDDTEAELLRQIMGGGSSFEMPSLEIPGLADIGKITGGTRFAGMAAPLIAALPMMYAQDPIAGQMAGQKLMTTLADQALIGAHRSLASAEMPQALEFDDSLGGMEQAMMNGGGQASAPSGRSPGIQRTGYGDRVEFETPDGIRYRLIHGTKDLKTGTYVQGGWGPQGPNQYGDHFDVARVDGGQFDRAALDKFAVVNGKPLSAGLTVKGGEFGASRDGGARVHKAWDYAFGKGARLQLANGARWLL